MLRSAYYAAIVTGAYRHAIDAAAQGIPLDPVWREEVEKVSHRHYSTGFYYGYPGQFYEDSRYIRDWQVAAIVQDCTADGLATLSLRNKFKAGDQVELVGPGCKQWLCRTYDDGRGRQLFGGAEKAPDAVPDAAAPCRPTSVHSSAAKVGLTP